MSTELLPELVKQKHRIFNENEARWRKLENILRAKNIEQYLQAFYWEALGEAEGTAHLQARKDMVTFINFGARHIDKMTGALMREAPTYENGISTGLLGAIRAKEKIQGDVSRAEMLYYDINRRGEGMHSFNLRALRLAFATGHRWMGMEMPKRDAALGQASLKDEQLGFRPYAVSLSPTQVPMWEYRDGRLMYVMIKFTTTSLLDAEGKIDNKPKDSFLIYCDATYTEAGNLAGFWHHVDDKGAYIVPAGPLDKIGGIIPYRPLIYAADDEDMSLPGGEGLISVSLAYMNLGSAGDNDAIEGGGRSLFILGGNTTTHNKAVDQKKKGGRFITIEATPAGEQMLVPTIYDMASVSASSAIELAIKRKQNEAEFIAADELTRGPTTSGEARAIEFLDVKAPRLAINAAQLEALETFQFQTGERYFGAASPAANVIWPRKFSIDTKNQDWTDVADMVVKFEAKSATLAAKGVVNLLRERGLITNEKELKDIEAEVMSSIKKAQEEADILSRALSTAGNDPGNPNEPANPTNDGPTGDDE